MKTVNDQVLHIDDQVWKHVYDQLMHRVRHRVWNHVDGQVYHQLWIQVHHEDR